MKNKEEKGFALILSIVLMLAMSLMGGGLIIIASGDHSSNNSSEDYQQTFYVAETALLEGERYLLNKFLGPWDSSKHERDKTKRALPDDTIKFKGKMEKINYNKAFKDFYETDNICFQSFSDINTNEINISYDQLRDRLPPEISDDIVLLLSQSYEAFADFAEIQTQADVNEFNIKYNVQLFLPQQSGA